MSILRELKRRTRQLIPQVISACVLVYFVYHGLQGDRGFLAWLQLTQELEEARAMESRLGTERQLLESRVRGLQPQSLDPDLLDRQARAVLNLGHPDDIIVLVPRSDVTR